MYLILHAYIVKNYLVVIHCEMNRIYKDHLDIWIVHIYLK